MKMRSLVIVALLVTSSICAAHAAPASLESIETLLALTKSEEMLDSYLEYFDRLRTQNLQSDGGKPLSEERKRAREAAEAKFTAIMRDELSWPSIKPLLAEVYSELFTQDELHGLIAFYRSPAGQAYLAKLPLVTQKTMQIMQTRVQTLLPKLKAAAEEARAEAKPEGRNETKAEMKTAPQ